MRASALWSVADRQILIHVVSPQGLSDQWKEEIGRFARENQSDIHRRPDIEVSVELTSRWQKLADEPAPRFVIDATGRTTAHLNHSFFSGTLTNSAGRFTGRFLIHSARPPLLAVVIRSCLAVACEEESSLLLHASGVRRNGRLWIFCGPSGSGKTTIATDLRHGGETFSLENVILRETQKGAVWAYSTPFSDLRGALRRPEPGPVAGLFYIAQSMDNWLEPMSTHRAVKSFLSESYIFSKRIGVLAKLLGLMGRMVENGACYDLRFKRDMSFWQLVD